MVRIYVDKSKLTEEQLKKWPKPTYRLDPNLPKAQPVIRQQPIKAVNELPKVPKPKEQ